MSKLISRIMAAYLKKHDKTGLEQDLNQGIVKADLALPEILPAARRMAADGTVILKNDGDMLPLSADTKVAVFGRSAVNYFTVGYGSGGDVVTPYRSSLMDGLRDAGVKFDAVLADKYAAWCARPKNVPDEGYWGHWPMSNPEMHISAKDVSDAAKRNDAALVVIGRAAGEARENVLEKGSFYLTDGEKRMLSLVTKYFNKVCVIMDCGNVIDMGWTLEYGSKLTAIVYAWQGGMESGYALTDILTGKVNPSARLTDTIAVSYEDYPSSAHFGNLERNEYTEDIYVGYRYFETFAKSKVLWPFGHGLSYTTFKKEASAANDGNSVKVSCKVTNTGKRAGRETVLSYLSLPCGKLGNPALILAGFAKTRELMPGESETLAIDIDLSYFAPYDDSGVTGHKSCRVLEAGSYGVLVGGSAREAEEILRFEKAETEVTLTLSEQSAVRPESAFKRLVNKGGAPVYEDVPLVTKDLRKQILDAIPAEMSGPEGATFDDVLSGKLTAEQFVGSLSVQELDDITHGEGKMNSAHGPAGNAGMFGGVTETLRNKGVPPVITTDGPSGIRLKDACSLLPCGTALASSFDTEGVQTLYALIGKEMTLRGTNVLLGPGMNIHRDPLCGRNFEYYSEDPYLTGKIAAAMIRGIQSSGNSACPKHFACNNQETNREHNDSRLSERALRDIYLRGFEIAITEAKPLCIMSSYNKINGIWNHYNYELCTAILRGEWGYKGLIITDWWMREGGNPEFPNITNDACRVRAQVDVLMPGEVPNLTLQASLKDPDGVKKSEAQRCALNVINFILNLKALKK